MTKGEILEFLNTHPVCHLATAEGDQPHVRGMMMYRADADGILFHTGDFKSLCLQLRHNPRVELCFNDLQAGKQVRVLGVATFVDDQALKEEIVAAREFLKPWVAERGYDMLKVIRVTQCRAAVWSMAANFAKTEFIEL